MPVDIDTSKIAVIGVPSSAGARKTGQELAPQSLRVAGLLHELHAIGHEVIDLGDMSEVSYSPDTQNPRQQNLQSVLSVLEQVREVVDSAITKSAWPLIIGGDCTVTIGVLAALQKHFADLGMVYVDGDVDLNTPATTHSGIFDGMVLAHVLGQGEEQLSRFAAYSPLLDERNILLFGYSKEAGGIDPVEIELLKDTRMAKYPLERIGPDIRSNAMRALQDLESKAQHILVHFDVDVIDFDEFPAVDVPHRPGFSLEQAAEALGVFLSSSKSVGLVVTEFNAAMDSDGKLAQRLCALIRAAMRRPD